METLLDDLSCLMEKYSAHHVDMSGDHVYLRKAREAMAELDSALQAGDTARAAFSAFALVTNVLSLGEWYRFWAYRDIAISDNNKRATDHRNKGFDQLEESLTRGAAARWTREKEETGEASTTAGSMAKKVLSENAEYLEMLIANGTIIRRPTQETVKKWFIKSGAVPPGVRGKRGRPTNNK
jgi:hypothetical protein